jgi:hypothetical protein
MKLFNLRLNSFCMKDVILGVLRHGLTAGGGALVTTGLANSQTLDEAVGALMTLVGVAWSIWEKYKSKKQAP